MKETKNEIVVYQLNKSKRLEVRFANDSVWLTQGQMAELFGCSLDNIGLHLKNVYACGELRKRATTEESSVVRFEGNRNVLRKIIFYNLDAIISVGYRVNSILGVKFRQWATGILREYMLRGYAFNQRFNDLEDKMDRRFAKTEADVTELREKVDFFVQTSLPPVQGVFYDGQVFDAEVFVAKHILSAKRSILLIDNYVNITTLEMLAKKEAGVRLEIVTSKRGNELTASDIEKFNEQYGNLIVIESTRFHDRFLIIDDEDLFLVGASIKDLGKKCFAFTKLDSAEISGLKARI